MIKFFKAIRRFFFGLTKAEKEEFESAKKKLVEQFKGISGSFVPERPKPATPKELKTLFDRYNEAVAFVPGDIVMWKEGLKNRRFPEYGQPVIVHSVTPGLFIPEENAGAPTFREPISLRIGEVVGGDFEFFHADPQRFTKYIPAPVNDATPA